jgi:hypothetical protein
MSKRVVEVTAHQQSTSARWSCKFKTFPFWFPRSIIGRSANFWVDTYTSTMYVCCKTLLWLESMRFFVRINCFVQCKLQRPSKFRTSIKCFVWTRGSHRIVEDTSRLVWIPGEIVSGTDWIGGWVNPGAVLNAVEKRKIFPVPGIKHRPSSPLLYRLS